MKSNTHTHTHIHTLKETDAIIFILRGNVMLYPTKSAPHVGSLFLSEDRTTQMSEQNSSCCGHRAPSAFLSGNKYDSVSWEVFFSMCQMKMLKSLCYSKKHQFLLELLSDAYSRTIFSNVATLLDFFSRRTQHWHLVYFLSIFHQK